MPRKAEPDKKFRINICQERQNLRGYQISMSKVKPDKKFRNSIYSLVAKQGGEGEFMFFLPKIKLQITCFSINMK